MDRTHWKTRLQTRDRRRIIPIVSLGQNSGLSRASTSLEFAASGDVDAGMTISSCPGLSRASTSLEFAASGDVDAGMKPGRDGRESAMSTTTDLPDIPLPHGIRSRFVDDINGLSMHVLEAGYETPGRPLRAAAARLSRARLQLAQGDAGAGGGRLSRDRAGPARLWPHRRLGRRLRRRSRLVPAAQSGARRARPGVGVRPPQGRCRGRP